MKKDPTDILLKVERSIYGRIPNGLRVGLANRFNYLFDRLVDRYYSIDTLRNDAEFLDVIDPEVSTYYTPSPWFTIRKVLRQLPIQASDVFFDVGCGKGRMLLVAATFPFAEVRGVDLAEKLYQVARLNIDTYFAKIGMPERAKSVKVIHSDVHRFEIGADVTVMYMYGSLVGKSFDNFMRSLSCSLKRHPRDFFLIYSAPRYCARLKDHFTMDEILIPNVDRRFCRTFRLMKKNKTKPLKKPSAAPRVTASHFS